MAVAETFVAGPYNLEWFASPGIEPNSGDPRLVDYATPFAAGIVEDGFTIQEIAYWDAIKGDNMGDATQDGVFRGKDVFIDFILSQWMSDALSDRLGAGTPVKSIFTPFCAHPAIAGHGGLGSMGQVGRLVSSSSISCALQLTRVNSNTASTSGYPTANATALDAVDGRPAPDVIMVPYAVLAPNYPLNLMLQSRHRKIPVRFQLLPATLALSSNTQIYHYYTKAVTNA